MFFSGTFTTRYLTITYLLSYHFIELNEASKPNIDWLVILFGHRDVFLRHSFSSKFYDMSHDVG